MTAADAITRAQNLLNDAGAARWSTDQLMTFLRDFLAWLYRNRPDARWDNSGAYIPYTELTWTAGSVPTTDLWCDDRWREPAGLYVAACGLELDGADQADAVRAKGLRQRFDTLTGSM